MQRNLVSQERALDTDGFEYDPFSFAVHANPWPYYRVLRRRYPVYRNVKRNFWALSRFDDVRSAARDWHTYSSGSGVELDGAPGLYTELFGPGDFLNLDPEAHDRIRKVVHQGFTPRSINVVGDAIRQRAIALAQTLVERGNGDVAEDFGWKMPLFGICRLVGFPDEDLEFLQRLLIQLLRRPPDDPLPDGAKAAAREAQQYVHGVLEERRKRPRADLLTEMVRAEDRGLLRSNEVDGLAFLMFEAGMDTTASVLSYAIGHLANDPEERARITTSESRAAMCFEEMTRYEAPVHGVARVTTRPVQLHGHEIDEGEWIWLMHASACRDERVFVDPDTFWVDRPAKRHLGFGEGIHHCIGAPLARLIGRISLHAFCCNMGDYEVGAVELLHNTSVPRDVVALPIIIGRN